MRRYINKTVKAVCALSFLFVSACSTFESEPLEWNREEAVTNPKDSLAENMKFLFNATYNSLPSLHTRLSDSYLDAATDDGVATRDKGGSGSLENYRNGSLSPENIASLDGSAWDNFYVGIRRANLFLQKIEGYPFSTQLPEAQVVKMKAETRVLRAYFYFELVKRWGGVPLVGDKVFEYDEKWNIPRSSLTDCVNYIMDEISPESPTSCYNDLYEAMSIPPQGQESTMGRMNKGVVLSLISRMKLYLASPLYNEDDNKQKWEEAAQAAQKVMALGIYGLNPGYLELFGDTKVFPNKEVIMVKETSGSTGLETNNSPCGYTLNKCKGLTSPSQNLVDAFLTLDGKRIGDPSSKYVYDSQNPYANRDPRLKYTVFCNGSRWLNREVETFNGGLDRSNKPGLFITQTGYYLRKFLSLNEEKTSFASVAHHYQIIRYGEILLNYAEALNEVNTEANAATIEDCLIQLRTRAGIEAGTDNRYGLPATYTQTEMREIIRNERRIELAFEEHRFWDIRRWKIAESGESVMMKPVKGVVITRQADNTFHYEYVDVRISTFDVKMYWYPIPRGEMQGNSELTQNPGWNY